MGKTGDAVSLTLNGVRFAIPKDVTPNIIKGGLMNTDTQDYGTGESDTYQSYVVPKITGLQVKVSEANKEAFERACATPDIPIICETVTKSYELTGSIIAGDGLEIDITRGKTGDFEVRSTDGSGIRES